MIEAVFPDKLPEINHAITVRRPKRRAPRRTSTSRAEDDVLVCEVQQHLGDDRVRAVAMDTTDGLARGAEVHRHRRPDHRSGRREPRSGGSSTCSASRSTSASRASADTERWPIHRPRSDGRGADADDGDLRDRHQGDRPARALRQGRQGRPVRRRRRRQDRDHPGADPQPRPGARRPVGLLRRRRALARGQRPVARDEGVGRPRQDDARLRPDERAARRPHARGALAA